MVKLQDIPPHIQLRLSTYAEAIGCSTSDVIQAAIADFLAFEGTELRAFSDDYLNKGIFEGLSLALQHKGMAYLDEAFADDPEKDKYDQDFLVESAIVFFLHFEAANFDDDKITGSPIAVKNRQLQVLQRYLEVPIAA